MRRILMVAFLCVTAIFLLSLSSCDLLFGSKLTPEPEKEWTIMVWMDGDNSLASEAVYDFHEMEYGLMLAQQTDPDILDDLSVIVQFDHLTNDKDYEGIYKVLPSSTSASSTSSALPLNNKRIAFSADPNMGSAEELANFIDTVKYYFPAKKYALILWNHGGGVRSIKEDNAPARAICWDDGNDEDALYIGEIKDNLTSDHSVDFLGMDACLMGFLEVAYEFRPGTNDFGADAISFSPATEQGDGWEYHRILNRLGGAGNQENLTDYDDGHPGVVDDCVNIETLTANQFAGIVAKEYKDAFSNDSWETQTALDLTQIAAVKSAVDSFAAELVPYKTEVEDIRGYVSDHSMNLMAYFNESDSYSSSIDSDANEWLDYAGFDLYELAEQVGLADLDSNVNSAASALKTAVDDAIIYSWAESSYTGYGTGVESGKNGLAIFFPDGNATYQTTANTYWYYQDWYNGVDHDAYVDWWQNDLLASGEPQYGALDFCTSDGDGTVESWFELLQYWYNPSTTPVVENTTFNDYNPSFLE